MDDISFEVNGRAGLITLNRPRALNALTLDMIRLMTAVLLAWREDPAIDFVAVRGQGREGPFGAFCAGGDIRFFHEAVLAGDPRLEDFFTEEYTLDHLIHTYPKPYAVFMDGVIFGGGMGISGHGRSGPKLRIATERTKMAMPETNIGLFPDVGGGWFLARCPGHVGEYLALTGQTIGANDAVALGLADAVIASARLPELWASLAGNGSIDTAGPKADVPDAAIPPLQTEIDRFFGLATVTEIVQALEADAGSFAKDTAAVLRKRSPLMLHVTLEHVRRARTMSYADDLRMERDMIRNCFHLRPGTASDTMEGIRALVIDKDQSPRWNPSRVEDVKPEEWQAFFRSPWPAHAHPLRGLA